MESKVPIDMAIYRVRAAFRVMLLLTCPLALAQRGLVPVEGVYQNSAYQYSVSVPRGHIAYRTKAPAPDHGVILYLDDQKQSFISVDASYNTREFQTAREATLDALRRWDCGPPTMQRSTLGALSAWDGEIRCTSNDGTMTAHRVVTALADAVGTVGTIYQIELQANGPDLAPNRELFKTVVQSFKLRPNAEH